MIHPEWDDLAADARDMLTRYAKEPPGFFTALCALLLMELHVRLADMELRESDDDDEWKR